MAIIRLLNPINCAAHAVALGALSLVVTPYANGQGLRPPWSLDGPRAPIPHPTRFGDQCDSVVASPDPSPDDTTYHPAQSTTMVIPDLRDLPESMYGQIISTRFLISASGVIDSVTFVGRLGPRFAATLRATARRYQFRPAIYQGCTVKGWSQITETFGRGQRPAMEPVPVEIVGREWPLMTQAPWTAPSRPLDLYALPGELSSCAKRRPSLSYGELPDPAAAHGNGRVVLRFVVDSTGEPVDSTVRVVQTSGPAFTAEVRRVFSSLGYQPAWCGAGPVAMDVQYTFVFVK